MFSSSFTDVQIEAQSKPIILKLVNDLKEYAKQIDSESALTVVKVLKSVEDEYEKKSLIQGMGRRSFRNILEVVNEKEQLGISSNADIFQSMKKSIHSAREHLEKLHPGDNHSLSPKSRRKK